jgi:small subunit ribosomal protein S18
VAPRQRTRSKDQNPKKIKKKVSVLTQERVEYVDYKDVNLLQRFMSDRSKIRARRVSGNDTQQQREVAVAIKNAREMALLPYTKRVATQRGPKGERGEGGDRRGPRDGERADTTESAIEPEGVDEVAEPGDELGEDGAEALTDTGTDTDADDGAEED